MKITRILTVFLFMAYLSVLIGCSNAIEKADGRPTYNVGFKTIGLAGSGLVVQITGVSELNVDGEGTYTFATDLKEGKYFELAVKQQPTKPNQICSFSKLSGEIFSNVELVLSCKNILYSMGGDIRIDPKLLDQLIVAVNGNPTGITIDGAGNFQFKSKFNDALELKISFIQVPKFQSCTINNNDTLTAKITGSDITNLSIECLFSSALIDIQPLNFDINKKDAYTTPSIYNYITDIEIGGNPDILQWNSSVTAKFGSVVNNGNGTFTYIPNENIRSGLDSFSFEVVNTSGTHALGIVTLNIAKGWGNLSISQQQVTRLCQAQ